MTETRRGAPLMPMDKRIARWLTTKTRQEGACRVWTGALDTDKTRAMVGITEDGTMRLRSANRVIWAHQHPDEELGDRDVVVPSCGTALCVEPTHLEKMTRDERTAQIVATRDTCGKGHPRTPENVRVNTDGSRSCRVCDREGTAARRAAGRKS